MRVTLCIFFPREREVKGRKRVAFKSPALKWGLSTFFIGLHLAGLRNSGKKDENDLLILFPDFPGVPFLCRDIFGDKIALSRICRPKGAINPRLTFHDCVVLGHPGGDDRVLAEAVDLGQGADALVDLVSGGGEGEGQTLEGHSIVGIPRTEEEEDVCPAMLGGSLTLGVLGSEELDRKILFFGLK